MSMSPKELRHYGIDLSKGEEHVRAHIAEMIELSNRLYEEYRDYDVLDSTNSRVE